MNTYTQYYDLSEDPAMPVVTIQLMNVKTGIVSESFTAIIDSGSDASMFPLRYIKSIAPMRLRPMMVSGIHGKRKKAAIYMVAVNIGSISVRGIRAAARTDTDEALLGRDVLNQLVVTLDGFAQEVELRD